MQNFNNKYFLAANSCEGFISTFNDYCGLKNGWFTYIIKGGPGTGKSSFMKFLAAKAADKNIEVELFPCSSDPDSLDAIIFPQKKIMVLDGTVPHTVDPIFPAVSEEILNFGMFWEKHLLTENKDKIIKATEKNKLLHKIASKYLLTAGNLLKSNYNLALGFTDKNAVQKFAKKLCDKYIPKAHGASNEEIRFLCGITPKGIVSFANSVNEKANTQIIIEDKFGCASNIIMNTIRNTSILNGYDIITIKNALLPNTITDHIIIPELSLAFVREYEFQHFSNDGRRIHARRYTDMQKLKNHKERLNLNRKISKELLLSACETLKEAKAAHDDLEKFYIGAMDFTRLTKFANDFAEKLF
ncbi:MAG: hypothetical protein E7560_02395 [Ruminococcaceae bacterium]|nr:hypothetical protein [Oscillospiraceae bacterium]